MAVLKTLGRVISERPMVDGYRHAAGEKTIPKNIPHQDIA